MGNEVQQHAKLIARIAENLPDMDSYIRQGWIDNPKALRDALRDALCPPDKVVGELKLVEVVQSFPSTIILGLHKTVMAYRNALCKAGFKIGNGAGYLLSRMTCAQQEVQLNLVLRSVRDLRFPQGATIDQIYKRAEELGLELCPAETGPALRLAYTGSDWMAIGMKPISVRDGDPGVFYLGRGADDLRLDADNASPAFRWDSNDLFVFHPRKLEA